MPSATYWVTYGLPSVNQAKLDDIFAPHGQLDAAAVRRPVRDEEATL